MGAFTRQPKKNKKTDSEPFSSSKNFNKYLTKFLYELSARLDKSEKNLKVEFEKAFNRESMKSVFNDFLNDKNNEIIEQSNKITRLQSEEEKRTRAYHRINDDLAQEKSNNMLLREAVDIKNTEIEKLDQFNENKKNEIEQIKRFISDDHIFLNAIENDLNLFNTVKTISNILYELNDFLKLRDLKSAREVITSDYEKNITLCISSLLVNYGLKTDGFDKLLIGVNNRILTYLIEYKDEEGSPMNSNDHVATDSSKNTFIEKYHTLTIKNKELNNSLTFKAIIDAK
jgi:hypothetical protein